MQSAITSGSASANGSGIALAAPGRGDGPSSSEPSLPMVSKEPSAIHMRLTRHSQGLGVVVMLMLVAAINYQSNAAWGLVFAIVSAAALSGLHARRNLAGISAMASPAAPVFADEPIRFGIVLANSQGADACGISVTLPDAEPVPAIGAERVVNAMRVGGLASASITVELPPRARGAWSYARMRVATSFPLGLIEAWRDLPVTTDGVVYPRPSGERIARVQTGSEGGDDGGQRRGGDDFNGHRRYQPGDSQHHIDWKAHARGRSLLVKEFVGAGGGLVWCDWSAASGDVESRLAQLARWIVEAHRAGFRYGLRIPGSAIAPAMGNSHYHACLRALALHPRAADGEVIIEPPVASGESTSLEAPA